MIQTATIFRTTEEARGFFDSFFHGVFLIKGIPITFQLALYIIVPALIVCLYCYYQSPSKRLGQVSKVIAYSIFILSTLLLFQPWDEVFVNLQHSYNLAVHGTYSFSAINRVEGTVDFLPYFIFGILAKLGFPLLELLYFQGVVGGLLCLWAGQKILKKLDFPHASVIGLSTLVFYIPLLLNSSHGFTTPYFAAAILWALYFLLFEEKPVLTLILFSLIPLIRVEGIWFVLVMGALFHKRLPTKQLVSSVIPFVCLSMWRYWYFGSALPIPVEYKASLGNFFFFVFGMRNFAADMISTHTVTALAVIFLIGKVLPSSKAFKNAYTTLIGLIIFSFPYYLSGGDWFPSCWARYLLPFSLFAVVVALARLAEYLKQNKANRIFVVFAIVIVFCMEQLPLFGSYQRYLDYAIAPRKVLAEVRPRAMPAIPYRVHYLSQVGRHLLKTTLPTDRIATSELSTISYFAERESLDMLGITNKEIASMPLRATPSLWRKSPRENELPYLIFKRLNPALIDKYHPEYIYAFDFMMASLMKDVPVEEWSNEKLLAAFARWQTKFKGLTTPVYGELEKLMAKGYSPVIVLYGNEFCTLYFVSDAVKQRHFDSLKANGFVKSN